jgi:hypothetical protein
MNRHRAAKSAVVALGAAIGIGSFAAPARAALVSSESFAYNTGDLGPASPANNGGTGWEDAGWNISSATGSNPTDADVVANSLGYGALSTAGNSASLAGKPSTLVTTIFRDQAATRGGAGTDLWLAFTIAAGSPASGVSLYSTIVTPTSAQEVMFLGTLPVQSGATKYGATLKAGTDRPLTGSTASNLAFPSNTANGTGPHFYVVHLNQTGTPSYTFWLDPDVASLGTGTAPTGGSSFTVTSGTQAFTFNRIRLAEVDTNSNAPVQIDEFRLGTTWADVSPVPEPGTAGVIAAAAGLCLARRRRRA